ncbi:hypothetical protein [uncultured Draconibacterium sp.]|uniref:hypothetical protein n=1 Tax=uncultured Draconibacterium sp. TaxID=1573823 RepID=UPI0029C85D27|nr:hypothetical protein [uncultured Draconibacterium sp.]
MKLAYVEFLKFIRQTVLAAVLVALNFSSGWSSTEGLHSPMAIACAPNNDLFALVDQTAGLVYFFETSSVKQIACVDLKGSPRDLCWRDDHTVWVSEYDNGTIAQIDTKTFTIQRRIQVGLKPYGIAWNPAFGLMVSDYGRNQVEIIPVSQDDELVSRRKDIYSGIHHPGYCNISNDGSIAVVCEMIPSGVSTDYSQGIKVWIWDKKNIQNPIGIKLAGGTGNGRQVKISPDKKWAYVVHTRGRIELPTSQIERGWINTNAMSIIDLQELRLYTTFLLDQNNEGAADPWGLELSKDGKTAWVTLAGAHALVKVNLEKLHGLLAGKLALDPQKNDWGQNLDRSAGKFWKSVAINPERNFELIENLGVMYSSGILVKTRLPIKGPRALEYSSIRNQLIIPGYFDGKLLLIDKRSGLPVQEEKLAEDHSVNAARRGEILFYDGDRCYQDWLSCATCHPGGGRADGQNWDLLNDGIGNPKNVKSLLWANQTPPSMWTGVRKDYEQAVMAGMNHFQYNVPTSDEFEDVKAYIRSLKPEKSPFLIPVKDQWVMSSKAKRGEKIFTRKGCVTCHPSPLFTDLLMHDVGTRHEADRTGQFDTPPLVELWNTGPYLHDGSMDDLMKVINHFAPKLSLKDKQDLLEYLLSL